MKKGTSRSQVNNFSCLIGGNQIYQLATGDLLMGETYTFNYNGRNANCGQFGTIYISVGWDNNPNKIV